jgi:hypothetical protein
LLDQAIEIRVAGSKYPREPISTALGHPLAVCDHLELTGLPHFVTTLAGFVPDGFLYVFADRCGMRPTGAVSRRRAFDGLQIPCQDVSVRTEHEDGVKMQQLVAQGRVVQSNPGNVPQYKRYLDEMHGIPLQNLWTDIPPINMMAKERLGYPTQKPEPLLERIVKCSTNEGELVLDCFVGSGTTAAVAEKLNRRWIVCDLSRFAIHTTKKRLLEVRWVPKFLLT